MIYYKPNETLDLYKKHLRGKADMRLLANDEDTEFEIYMCDFFGVPKITVACEGSVVEAVVTNLVNLESEVEDLYKTYITDEPDTPDESVQEQLIEERETDLEEAVCKFLSVVLKLPEDDVALGYDDIADDFLEHALEYLYRKNKSDIYRPMFLVDDEGNESFSEHPYPELEFDDPANLYD